MGNGKKVCCFSPLTAGVAYIRVFIFAIHAIHMQFTYSNTNYRIITFIFLNFFLYNVHSGKKQNANVTFRAFFT